MRLSCSDYSFPLLPHDDACELIRMLGFDAVDVGLWGAHSHLRPGQLEADPVGWAERLEQRIHGRGLAIADVFLIPHADYAVMAVNNPSADERARGRERFEEIARLAAQLGVPGLSLIPGLDFDGVDHEASLELAAEELSARVEVGRTVGVRVSVEPHIGSVSASPADLRRLLELAPGLEVTLDVSHFVMQGFAVEELDPVLPRVRHVHTRAARAERLQVGMKENAIDFERLLDALRAVDYDGCVSCEYLWIDQGRCDEADTLSETILMRDRLRKHLDGGEAAAA